MMDNYVNCFSKIHIVQHSETNIGKVNELLNIRNLGHSLCKLINVIYRSSFRMWRMRFAWCISDNIEIWLSYMTQVYIIACGSLPRTLCDVYYSFHDSKSSPSEYWVSLYFTFFLQRSNIFVYVKFTAPVSPVHQT